MKKKEIPKSWYRFADKIDDTNCTTGIDLKLKKSQIKKKKPVGKNGSN